jgi:NAD(P)-dependent dehydrogenase (short-subunit alcohol dehydrogenase family)
MDERQGGHDLEPGRSTAATPQGRRIETLDRLLSETKQIERAFLGVQTVEDRAFRAKAARIAVKKYAQVHDKTTFQAALSGLTREMAVEFAQLGVRVNAVAPGEIETDMISADYEPLITRIPMHRMGTTAEVAGVIYRLCDADFGYVTGSEIFVTGGQQLL